MPETMRTCKTCEEEKPESEFYEDGRWRKGSCKSCMSEAGKAKRATDPNYRSEMAEYMREYRRNNPGYRKANAKRVTERRRERKQEQKEQEQDSAG